VIEEQRLHENNSEEPLVDFVAMPERERMMFVYSVLSKDKGFLNKTIRRVAGPDEIPIDYNRDVQRRKINGR
jgi:hypothetical protein